MIWAREIKNFRCHIVALGTILSHNPNLLWHRPTFQVSMDRSETRFKDDVSRNCIQEIELSNLACIRRLSISQNPFVNWTENFLLV